MNKTVKIVGGILLAAAIGAGVYFGFIKKTEEALPGPEPTPEPETKAETPNPNPKTYAPRRLPPKLSIPKPENKPIVSYKIGEILYAKQAAKYFSQPATDGIYYLGIIKRFETVGNYIGAAATDSRFLKILRSGQTFFIPATRVTNVKA